jgi:hypothetical protein
VPRDQRTLNLQLVRACSAGDADEVIRRLAFGADIHYNTDDPLYTAICGGHVGVVKELIRRGANVNSDDGYMLNAAMFEPDASPNARREMALAILRAPGFKVERISAEDFRAIKQLGIEVSEFRDSAKAMLSAPQESVVSQMPLSNKSKAHRLIGELLGPAPAVEPGIDEPLAPPAEHPDSPPLPDRGPSAPDPDDPWRPRRIHPGTEPRPKARHSR